jgi:hypothetical protein
MRVRRHTLAVYVRSRQYSVPAVGRKDEVDGRRAAQFVWAGAPPSKEPANRTLAGDWEAAPTSERAGQNKRFCVVRFGMLTVLARWDGDAERAIGHLREVKTLAEEMGSPGELWQIRAALGELHEDSGDEERAGRAFSWAAETLRSFASRIDDPTLTSSGRRRCGMCLHALITLPLRRSSTIDLRS